MTKTQIAEILSKGIEKYTGEEVLSLKFIQDPVVDNTWAMRAQLKNIGEMDCMVILGNKPLTIDNVDNCFEECMFNSWPPRANPDKCNTVLTNDMVQSWTNR